MARAPSIAGRLARLEQSLPRRCPACAGRPDIGSVIYDHNGVLQTRRGQQVTGADLRPCPVCGKGASEGLKVVRGVDPACL